jgi:site-specific DNA-methyltransferase (cytosine-N4-specific)
MTEFVGSEGPRAASAQGTLTFPLRTVRREREQPLAQLACVGWDFTERVQRPIETLHPYPAKFINNIPNALLDALPVPRGSVVLDPFCGSGTTLVECQARGIASVGLDLNPIACLISRVKTAPAPRGTATALAKVLKTARGLRKVKIPAIPNLEHWFSADVIRPLACLTAAIASTSREQQDVLRLALSSILVRVSNQESDTRYAAVEKNVTADDVFNLFERAVLRISMSLEARSYVLRDVTVKEANTLNLTKNDFPKPVGLVITSPPYPNAYEYWLYHKYRMWWLGFDPLAVKEQEIGARAHFFKRNHHTAEHFPRQMETVMRLLASLMPRRAHACFVVGRSKIHGSVVDNAQTIRDVGKRSGFETIFSVERTLSASRKSFNLSHANIKTETVIVLRKERD